MSAQPFRLVTLDAGHDRKRFDSGSAPLDRYLREQAAQDIRRRVAACFVAVTDEQRIAGYYTLASASVALNDLPEATAKKLPRYPSVPAVRMGRLAVDRDFKGAGLGGALLADALRDCCVRSHRGCEGRDGSRLLQTPWVHRLAIVCASLVSSARHGFGAHDGALDPLMKV
jgi:ribosomal protein S18 acetylase RimI-like enzyme